MPSFDHDRRCVAIVVAYRSAATITDCVLPLLGDPAVGEVVVVDNSGDHKTASLIARLGRGGVDLRYVDPGWNAGFAAGCNIGMARSTAPVIALVNPDVRLTRSLGELTDLLSTAPRSIAAGGLTDAVGRVNNVRREANFSAELYRATLGSPPPNAVPEGGGVRSVHQVDGALMLFERELVQDLGGLCEVFPLYYEDVEFCWRVRRAGGSVYHDAAVYGRHDGGTSSSQNHRAYKAFRVSRQRWLRMRYGFAGMVGGVALTVVELVSRTVGRTPEGFPARWTAFRACAAEALRPLSLHPLGNGR